MDFVTIHMTFPAINAWISYQIYYAVMVTTTTMCETSYFDNIDTYFCDDYKALLNKSDP